MTTTVRKVPSAEGKLSQPGHPAVAQRSASSIKDALLKWCQQVTEGYENVKVTNFSSSWSDGMAFCAIVHHYFPNAFDFAKLDPKRRKGNFKLAFDLAEKLGDVPQLLEVEDMVRMKQPDWKCVFTYVQTMYRKLHDKQPKLLPPRGQSSSSSSEVQVASGGGGGGGSSSGIASSRSSGVHEDEEAPSNPFNSDEFQKLTIETTTTTK